MRTPSDAVPPTNLRQSCDPPYTGRTQRSRSTHYGDGFEAQAVRKEIGNFQYETSRGFQAVQQNFGSTIRLLELKGIVMSAIHYVKRRHRTVLPKLSRNAKRSFPLMIKYINTHYEVITPTFRFMTLLDENHRPLPLLDRQLLQ
jgi:hypothetical protein